MTSALSPAMILARAAELREDAIKDKTYRLTPIGRVVGMYLDELAFRNYSDKTVENREQVLGWLALDLANLEVTEVTTDVLKDFLTRHWTHAASNTRITNTSYVRVFFDWCHENELIPANPAGKRLKAPRSKDTERRSHALTLIRKLVVAQDSRRDRIALLLMYHEGLRRNELRVTQFRHFDLARRVHTVFGKGGTVLEQHMPVPLALEIERYILDEQPEPHHFLLYPWKIGRRGTWPNYVDDVLWSKPEQPLSSSGMDKWWQRCVRNAGLPHFPMHELRHSAGTHFHEHGRDLYATQQFMRHKDPSTTARTYVHLDRVKAVAQVQRDMPDPMDAA